jgi:hypothetical protein
VVCDQHDRAGQLREAFMAAPARAHVKGDQRPEHEHQ